MRIKRTDRDSSPPIRENAQTKAVDTKHSAFFDTLQEYGERDRREGLDNLLEMIDEAAKKLLSDRSLGNLRLYRETVQSFMKEAVSASYRVRGEHRWDFRGNRRALYLVEKVNQELEELAAIVLKKQEDAIEVMAKMDEIRGLLVDLYY